MARKERKRNSAGEYELEINLTPMIDVVFNLIIFFMVITDMTQKDLEYLVLPKAAEAEVDEGKDQERIIINIINFDLPELARMLQDGRLNRDLPPIMIQGRQVKDLDQMRAWLRERADPRQFPDTTVDRVGGPSGPTWPSGRPIYPSYKPLLVRCDQGQIFGWVQAVMQYCTFVPGQPQAKELTESPLIYKLEIAVKERDPEGK
jgi:hypothetical protein